MVVLPSILKKWFHVWWVPGFLLYMIFSATTFRKDLKDPRWPSAKVLKNEKKGKTRWWFQICFIFTPIWGRFPFWLIFFNWAWNHQLTRKRLFRVFFWGKNFPTHLWFGTNFICHSITKGSFKQPVHSTESIEMPRLESRLKKYQLCLNGVSCFP